MPRGDGTRRGKAARSGPSQPESEREGRNLTVRLSSAQRARLEALAEAWGLSLRAAVIRLIEGTKEEAPG